MRRKLIAQEIGMAESMPYLVYGSKSSVDEGRLFTYNGQQLLVTGEPPDQKFYVAEYGKLFTVSYPVVLLQKGTGYILKVWDEKHNCRDHAVPDTALYMDEEQFRFRLSSIETKFERQYYPFDGYLIPISKIDEFAPFFPELVTPEMQVLASALSLSKDRERCVKSFLQKIRDGGLSSIPYRFNPRCVYRPDNGRPIMTHQMVEFMYHLVMDGSVSLSQQGSGKTLGAALAMDWFMTDAETRAEWIDEWAAAYRGSELFGEEVPHIAEILKERPVISTWVIVAPNSVIYKWADELRDAVPHRQSGVLQGSRVERMARMENSSTDIFVINYEGLLVLKNDIQPWLKERSPYAVVLDEAHWIKNPQAKRTAVVWDELFDAAKKMALSGTIKPNNFYDVHPSLTWLAPSLLNDRIYKDDGERYAISTLFSRFCDRWLIKDGYRLIVPHRHIEALRYKLGTVSVRYEKKECLDLPDKTFTERRFEMADTQFEAYKQALHEFVIWMDGEIRCYNKKIEPVTQAEESEGPDGGQHALKLSNILVRLLRMRQIAIGYASMPDGGMLEFSPPKRIQAVMDAIEEIDPDEKVVISGTFQWECWKLYHEISKRYGYEKTLTFYNGAEELSRWGPTDAMQRNMICRRFQESDVDRVRFVITNPALTAEGINLHSASYMIRASETFNFAHAAHFEDRIHRAGQKNVCTYIDIRASIEGNVLNIDDLINARLRKKGDLLALITQRINLTEKFPDELSRRGGGEDYEGE